MFNECFQRFFTYVWFDNLQ